MDEIIKIICHVAGTTEERFFESKNRIHERYIFCYLAQKYNRCLIKEISEKLDQTDTNVHMSIRHVKDLKDPELRDLFKDVEKKYLHFLNEVEKEKINIINRILK